MENKALTEIRLALENIKVMADHSRSMSIGAKLFIDNKVNKALKELEVIELELMMRK